jgi:hypothetical protein
MNMISTGTFQAELDHSNKPGTLVSKLVSAWEKKNAKLARAGGMSLMALSLAACGSSDDDTATTSTTTDTSTDTTTVVTPTVDASKEILLTAAQNIGASYTGGTGDDVFSGVIVGNNATGTTFQAGDVLTGGEGTDTLTVSVSGNGAGAFSVVGVDTNAVEIVKLSNFDTNAGETTIDTTLMDGLTTVGLSASSATGSTTFSGMASSVAAEMMNGSANLTLTYVATAVAGTADSQDVAVKNVSAGTFTANSIETINVTTSLAASTLTNIAGDALTGITLSGDQNLTVTTALTTKSIDASALSGKLTMTMGAQNTQTIKGGSGDDTIKSSTQLGAKDVIDGGAGADTLRIDTSVTVDATATTGELVGVSNVETIEMNSRNDAAKIDMTGVTGVTSLSAAASRAMVFDATATDTTNATNSAAIVFSLNGVSQTTGAQDGNATASEAATLIVATIDGLAGFTAVTNGNAGMIVTADTGKAIEFSLTSGYTNLDSSAYYDVTLADLAGTETVDIFGADLVTVTKEDASGSSDSHTINLATKAADKAFAHTIGDINLTNIESLTLTSNGMKVETAKTLSNLSGDANLTSLTISGDSDLVISDHGTDNTKLATIDASSMTGSLTLSDSVATLAQTISTGLGNDTVVMGGNLTNADVLDLGGNTTTVAGLAGTDKVTADLAAAGTSQASDTRSIANAETISFKQTTGNSFLDASKITNAGTIDFWNADGVTFGTTVTNLAAGVNIGLGSYASTNESNGTMTISLADETGTSDSLTLTIGDAANDDDVDATIKTTGIETINVARAATDADNAALNMTAAKAATINVTGATTAAAQTALGTLSTSTTKVDASAAPGLLSVTASATGTEIITKVGAAANTIAGGAGADTITLGTLNGDDADGAGGTDTLNATVKTSTTEATSNFEVVNYTIADNVQIATTANNGSGVDNATTFNLSGGNALTTYTHNYASPANLTTIDMSGYTGKSTSSVFAASQLANTMKITGSAGADTVTATTNNDNAAVSSMTGVETLVLNAAGGATAFDFAKTTGVTTVKTDDDNTARDITLTDLATGTKVEVTVGVTASGLIVDMADKAAVDNSLDIKIKTVAAAANVIDIDIDEVETTNINVDTAVSLDLAGLSMTTGTSTLNLSGDSAGTITALHTDVTTVDASGMATGGSVTQSARATTGAVNYTGSTGNDTFIMMAQGDVMDGGNGLSDTLDINFTGILGGVAVDLSSATDQVTSLDSVTNSAVQKNFENVDLAGYTAFGASVTGSAGANTIVGSAQVDSITGGNGADIIEGKAGADVLNFAESTAANDVLLYRINTDGTDTVNGWTTGDTVRLGVDGTNNDIFNLVAPAVLANTTVSATVGVVTALAAGDFKTGATAANFFTDNCINVWSTAAGANGLAAALTAINGGGSTVANTDSGMLMYYDTGSAKVELWYISDADTGNNGYDDTSSNLLAQFDMAAADLGSLASTNFDLLTIA